MTDMAFDREFYTVLCRYYDGQLHFAELAMKDATEDEVVLAIASGQLEQVVAVFSFNPVENFSRDVTEDVARAVLAQRLDDSGLIDGANVREFLENALGCRAVAEAESEVVS
jgi:hypothetical protein